MVLEIYILVACWSIAFTNTLLFLTVTQKSSNKFVVWEALT